MEVGGVRFKYSDRLLAEAAAERAQRGEVVEGDVVQFINPFSIHANLEEEFEKRSQGLVTIKNNYLDLKGMVNEGRTKCSLRCFPLTAVISFVWGNLAHAYSPGGQNGSKDLSRVFTPEELCEPKEKEKFNRSLIDVMVHQALKGVPQFYQSCGAPPLNSCLNRDTVSRVSKILGDLNKTCSELSLISQQIHEDQIPQLPKSKVIGVLQIAEGVRDECNSLHLALSTQALHIEAWPILRGHLHNLDQRRFSPNYQTTSLKNLLEFDRGMTWNDLVGRFGLLNLVSLYKIRDPKDLRVNPDLRDGDLRETMENREIRMEARTVKCKQEEDEVNIIEVVHAKCVEVNETRKTPEGAASQEESQHSEHRVKATTNSATQPRNSPDIPSPPFEPLETTSSRSVQKGSSNSDNPGNKSSDLEPQAANQNSAGNSNPKFQAGSSNGKKRPKSDEQFTEGVVPPVRVRITRQKASDDQPGVKYIVSHEVRAAPKIQHLSPGSPPYHGGLTFDEAKRTMGVKSIDEFFEFKRNVEKSYGDWGRDGVLEHEVKNCWGESVFEWTNSPQRTIWARIHEQGINRLRIPQDVSGPIHHLLNSPLVERPLERSDFKKLVGDWVQFMRLCTRIRIQPLGCILCQNQAFTYVYFGMYAMTKHLLDFHKVDIRTCHDLHQNALLKRPSDKARFEKWAGLAEEIHERLEKNLGNSPPSTVRDPESVTQKSNDNKSHEEAERKQIEEENSQEDRVLSSYKKEKGKGSKHKVKGPKASPKDKKPGIGEGNRGELKKALLKGCLSKGIEEQNRREKEHLTLQHPQLPYGLTHNGAICPLNKNKTPDSQVSDGEDMVQLFTDGEQLNPYH